MSRPLILVLIASCLAACARPTPDYTHNRYDYRTLRARVGVLPERGGLAAADGLPGMEGRSYVRLLRGETDEHRDAVIVERIGIERHTSTPIVMTPESSESTRSLGCSHSHAKSPAISAPTTAPGK